MHKYPMLLLEEKQAHFYPAEGGEVKGIPTDRDVRHDVHKGLSLISSLCSAAPELAAQLGYTPHTPDGQLLIGENFLNQPAFTIHNELVGSQVFVDDGRVTLSGVVMSYGFSKHGPFVGRRTLRISAYQDGRVLALGNARHRLPRRVDVSSKPTNIANGCVGVAVQAVLSEFMQKAPHKVREFFVRALEARGAGEYEQKQLRALPDSQLWDSGLLALRNPGLLSLPLGGCLPRELGRVLSRTQGLKATRRVLCGEGLPRSLTAALRTCPMALALVLAWRWRGATLTTHPRRKLPRTLHTLPGALHALLEALPSGRGELDWSRMESLEAALSGLIRIYGETGFVRLLQRSADDLSSLEEGMRVICDVQRMAEPIFERGEALPASRTLGALHDALVALRPVFTFDMGEILPLHSPLPEHLKSQLERLEGTAVQGDAEGKYLTVGSSSLHFKRVDRHAELEAIGREMDHCVGAYWGSVVRGSAHILVGRNPRGEPELCLEFDGQLRTLRQCKGPRNARVDLGASADLRTWLERTGVQIKTGDVANNPLEALQAA